MSPQRKGLVRPEDEKRIQRAVELKELATLELVAAVLDAMKHGGSIREVSLASGLSERTIIRWRKGQGLPTLDDWHRISRENRERLYEAYPGLKQVSAMLRELDGVRGQE